MYLCVVCLMCEVFWFFHWGGVWVLCDRGSNVWSFHYRGVWCHAECHDILFKRIMSLCFFSAKSLYFYCVCLYFILVVYQVSVCFLLCLLLLCFISSPAIWYKGCLSQNFPKEQIVRSGVLWLATFWENKDVRQDVVTCWYNIIASPVLVSLKIYGNLWSVSGDLWKLLKILCSCVSRIVSSKKHFLEANDRLFFALFLKKSFT